MASMYVFFLLGLFSCVDSYEKGAAQYGNYLFQYWGDGEDNTPWCESEQACIMKANPGVLVIANTKDRNDFLFDFIKYWDSPAVWIGGNDIHTERYWIWSDGTLINDGYTNWASGEPNNYNNEDCLEINTKPGLWNDRPCTMRFKGYICQSDLTKATRSNFVVLTFSDSFSGKSKTAASFSQARLECESRGLRLTLDVKNATVRKIIQSRVAKSPEAKYCIYADENNGKIFGAQRPLDEDCAGQLFPYICEGYRPHFMKVSDEAPVVEEAGDTEIECTADGYPVPGVTWHRNYDYVITTDTNAPVHQKKSPGRSTLVITNAKQGDTDRYRCFASNNINGEEPALRMYSDLRVMNNLN